MGSDADMEDYGFEYLEEEPEEQDVDIENQYYNSKVEGALQWREISWSRRTIQQKLGDVSTVLKAFADYVDGLCGTPYLIDYDIWMRRLRRNINEEDHVKEIDTSG